MAYVCQLTPNHQVYLENSGNQTVITSISGNMGQQQQSSSGFLTGSWTLPPQIYPISQGIMIKLTTATGDKLIQIQGNSMSIMEASPSLGNVSPLPVEQVTQVSTSPMETMKPMQPMKMGDMQMNMNPMTMKMGNMTMGMGETSQTQKRFCSQCGNSVTSGDRFCSSCGHSLT
ncbi:zinc ribbon domain-containing protein [Crocosphaera sp. XPORK-15E]|uniref:zinc ribbon domain-containing protein n=1 Tax=Crocosphaera sp. XPORK-15E TaxID=3110247 RepID=UPI002B1EDEC3|nr:zinc-ribbon domain-containing protein [Crocosphaera sp. XPORK-15E]MEA5536039.1 zinc-ribbon domain-containing protein [Crocosphaera sp. XPORK-15E]